MILEEFCHFSNPSWGHQISKVSDASVPYYYGENIAARDLCQTWISCQNKLLFDIRRILVLFFGNAFLVVKKMCSFINVGGFKLNDTVSKCINLTPIISGTTYS